MVATKHWGSSAWRFIHALTVAYPTTPSHEDELYRAQIIRCLQNLAMPCKPCTAEYTTSISLPQLRAIAESDDSEQKKRDSLIRWGIQLHNNVNAKLGKPVQRLAIQDIESRFSSDGSDATPEAPRYSAGSYSNSKIALYAGAGLVVLAGLYLFSRRCAASGPTAPVSRFRYPLPRRPVL